MDDKDVQAEQTSEQETTSTETETTQPEQTQEQPLTEERLLQILEQRDAEIRKYNQSRADIRVSRAERETAEANKRARLAESETAGYKTSFSNLDEDTQKDVELARLRGRDQFYQDRDQREELERGQAEYSRRLKASLDAHLEALGISLEDKRVDWGAPDDDLLSGRSKFDASVANILKEDRVKAEKDIERNSEERFKELERNLRKELNLDSVVDVSASPGVDTSDAAFQEGILDGSIPLTPENEKRLNRIQKIQE